MSAMSRRSISVQDEFAGALLDPIRSAPNDLNVPDGVDVQQRFDAHRNNATVGLVEALSATFPVTRALVGEDFFRGMACERIRADPPRSPVLSLYGEGFAEFIEGFAPAAGLPYLPDMARLELARIQAYHAADATQVPVAAYQALLAAPERLAMTRVELHPACRWLRSDHAVHSLWQAHQHAGAARDAALAEVDLASPEEMLVVRPQWAVLVSPLPARGCIWLDALQAGATLDEAASLADASQGGHSSASLEAFLFLLVQHGLAASLQSSPE
jgi:Putative DNA-binding domain